MSVGAALELSREHLRHTRSLLVTVATAARVEKDTYAADSAAHRLWLLEEDKWAAAFEPLLQELFESYNLGLAVEYAIREHERSAKSWWQRIWRAGPGPNAREIQQRLGVGGRETFIRGGVQQYVGLAGETGAVSGQQALERLGLNKTFAWAHQRNMPHDMFSVRGSKIIQAAHGNHMNRLTALIQEATSPTQPRTVQAVTRAIQDEWATLQRYQAARIARTETAIAWTTTAANTYEANGVTHVESLIAHGPSIGVDASGACDLCVEAAAVVHDVSSLDLPPYHPNCRCDIVPVLDDPDAGHWLPPDEPWAGGGEMEVVTEAGDMGFTTSASGAPMPAPGTFLRAAAEPVPTPEAILNVSRAGELSRKYEATVEARGYKDTNHEIRAAFKQYLADGSTRTRLNVLVDASGEARGAHSYLRLDRDYADYDDMARQYHAIRTREMTRIAQEKHGMSYQQLEAADRVDDIRAVIADVDAVPEVKTIAERYAASSSRRVKAIQDKEVGLLNGHLGSDLPGGGTELLRVVAREAVDVGRKDFSVNSLPESVGFYEKLGFKEVEKLRSMIGTGTTHMRISGEALNKLASGLARVSPQEARAGLYGVGRGPTGLLRNFRAMSDDKLRDTLRAIEREGDDAEALMAVREEARRRGIGETPPPTPPPPTPPPPVGPPPPTPPGLLDTDAIRAQITSTNNKMSGVKTRIKKLEAGGDPRGQLPELRQRLASLIDERNRLKEQLGTAPRRPPQPTGGTPPPPEPVLPVGAEVTTPQVGGTVRSHNYFGREFRVVEVRPNGDVVVQTTRGEKLLRADEITDFRAPAGAGPVQTELAREVERIRSRVDWDDAGGVVRPGVEEERMRALIEIGEKVDDRVPALMRAAQAKKDPHAKDLKLQLDDAEAKASELRRNRVRETEPLQREGDEARMSLVRAQNDAAQRVAGVPTLQDVSVSGRFTWDDVERLRREILADPEVVRLTQRSTKLYTDLRAVEERLWKATSDFEESVLTPLKHEYFLARRQAVKDALAEVRDMGSKGDRRLRFNSYAVRHYDDKKEMSEAVRAKTQKTLEEAGEHLPTTWLSRMRPIDAGTNRRGFHSDGGSFAWIRISNSTSRISGSKAGGIKADRKGLSTALHELGHEVESVIPRVRGLERTFYNYRTAGEPSKRIPGYGRDEVGRLDQFTDPYMGKDYGGRAWELLTMGLEDIFEMRYGATIDPEMRRFVLGLLAIA